MKFTRNLLVYISVLFCFSSAIAQAPPYFTSSDIYLRIQKLKVLGSVLYIAAHPDDENTRLLTWLSKDKLFKTGYLSLTRGDGGQNLIGDEQGIDLGMIRTQELLAARRIDGAEQFFARAFDFGFSKSTEEALGIWGKEKILSDVVWVIRKFQPDVIITRFPEDARAGHGHHSASSVLAHEAFTIAADPTRFPEQFKYGVKPWQAKRIFWNTFMFGSTNTTSEDQLKLDVGSYNPFLGKSYGEIAAESRSQHKTQGFGAPSTRGSQFEYFSYTAGAKAAKSLEEGVDITWKRAGAEQIDASIDTILKNYSLSDPQLSVPALVKLYKQISLLTPGYWPSQKMKEIQELVEACSGLWIEASSVGQFAVQGDSLRVNISLNDRLGAGVDIKRVRIAQFDSSLDKHLDRNFNLNFSRTLYIPDSTPVSQPYWLVQKMSEGSYNVNDQLLIGNPGTAPSFIAYFDVSIAGQPFTVTRPVKYKYADPVKGELYEPLVVVPPLRVSVEPEIVMLKKDDKLPKQVIVNVSANRSISGYKAIVSTQQSNNGTTAKMDTGFSLDKGISRNYIFPVKTGMIKDGGTDSIMASVELAREGEKEISALDVRSMKYDHIPDIYYFKRDAVKLVNIDLKIVGKKIGYIEGAGDKVPAALSLMGYDVTILKEQDIRLDYLVQFNAILTGVRAYNIHGFLSEKNGVLKEYVRNGGNLIVQYNTNSQVGPMHAEIGPYSFNISRDRVTDEHSPVNFLLPAHPVLNYPNKITKRDFDHWIQERAIYFADELNPAFVSPLSMNDPGEQPQNGSLVIADYGKGKFVYTGLVFFRELPAGIPGAYRLLANIIALNQRKNTK